MTSVDSGSDDVVLALHHEDAEYDSQLQVFHGGKAVAVPKPRLETLE